LNPKNVDIDGVFPMKLPQAHGSLLRIFEPMQADTDRNAAVMTTDADRISDVKHADTECMAAK